MSPLDLLLKKWQAPFGQLDAPYAPVDLTQLEIRWNKRMRSRAGVCRPRQRMIELNPNLLKEDRQAEEVLVHELCHMAVSIRWPTARPHGQKWKKLMTHMGFPPNRCHNLIPARAHRQKRWPLRCVCREHQVTTVIFNRIKKGTKYRCRHCKNILAGAESKNFSRGFFFRIFS
jgi:SprT protein